MLCPGSAANLIKGGNEMVFKKLSRNQAIGLVVCVTILVIGVVVVTLLVPLG